MKILFTGNIKTDIAFQGKKLSSSFNIKDKTEFLHKQDLVYHAECHEESCNDDYVGETVRRISERVKDQSRRGENYHILKVHFCRFENLSISSFSYQNNMLNISH